ncbi:MAG: right-handed parallel beta-helix repeat-containing protein, partial [Candidatus Aenigmarchaeota archaeon]|nr:right-handed parallel beta-helix repeat-containing protein [Candidatus Aenigmarchaeota archaeon]
LIHNSNVILTGNTIRNNFSGFWANGSISGAFTGNVVRDNVFQGFDLFGGNFNLLITDNIFYNNGGVYTGDNWRWEMAGISLGYRRLTLPSSIRIERNIFANNFAGVRCSKYGRMTNAKFTLWLRNNDFSKGGNKVCFSMGSDYFSNAYVIGVYNNFQRSAIYGVVVQNAEPGLINLGDLGNSSRGDDGGNRFRDNGSYDIYHWTRGPQVMKAEGNYWYTNDAKIIDSRIYDDDENPAYGPVDFEPFAISGELPVSETWSGVIPIAGDIVVPANGKLEIAPGTIVRFVPNFDAANSGPDTTKAELIVNGDLKFTPGPDSLPVIFESVASEPLPGDWGGIVCQSTSKYPHVKEEQARTSIGKRTYVRNFKNVIIRHAVCGLNIGEGQKLIAANVAFTDNITGLQSSQNSIIKKSAFASNTVAGARFTDGATGILENSVVNGNAAGLLFCNNANINCLKDTFADNGTGVVCGDGASSDFRQSVFQGNNNTGVRIYDNARPSFSPHNSFIGNRPYHISNHSENAINARLNYWGTNCTDSIAKYIWDGVDSAGYGIVDYAPLWMGAMPLTGGAQLELQHKPGLPLIYVLHQNYPNPMRTTTSISYAIPKQSKVQITIYGVTGQLVRTVMEKIQQPGYYSATWYGKDNNGRQAASGIYFYRLRADEFYGIKKLVLLR